MWKQLFALGICGASVLAAVTVWPKLEVRAKTAPAQTAIASASEAKEEKKEPLRIDLNDGMTLVETASPASVLDDLRKIQVPGVPGECRDAACYAVYRQLLSYDESGAFDCTSPVSRGEAVSALYRLGGVLAAADGCHYTDVPEEYRDAVVWAEGSGVSGGVSQDCFAPNDPVTRSQLAVMLQRFASWRGDSTDSGAEIPEEVPAYTEEAWSWVLERGLYTGMTDYGLYPNLPVSRLQFSEILARLQADRDPLAAALSLPERGLKSASQKRHEELQAAVDRFSKRHGAVGVQVAVIEKGIVTDTYNYGWSEQGATPMSSENKLRMASLSKVVVGLSAMLLREEGSVSLDEDISAYWGKDARNPSRPNNPVTIRSMLTHTSTIINNDGLSKTYDSVRARLGTSSGYGGGTPGNLGNWSYNNYAFAVLGQTLELASGRYLDDVLHDRILRCLDADCGFAAGDLEVSELVTPLYRVDSMARSAASVRSVHRWSSPGASGGQFAGGFTGSARDMAKIVALLAGDGCFEGVRLMEEESTALMESHDSQTIPGGGYQAMPLRCRADMYGRDTVYYHTGSAYGVYNLLSYDPVSGDGVVVLTMGADGARDIYGVYAVCGEISQAVYDAVK